MSVDGETREREASAELELLLAQIASVTSWEELTKLNDSRWEFLWKFRRETVEAWVAAEARLRAKDGEREKKRVCAEEAAFCPFVFYEVTYGIVAQEGEREPLVDTGRILSLRSEAGQDGWWVTVDGAQVRLAHLVMVEKKRVTRRQRMTWWCPTKATEWGEIRVPPSGAQLLINEEEGNE